MNLSFNEPAHFAFINPFAGHSVRKLVAARRSPSEASIELYGPIGEAYGGASAAQFAQALDEVKAAKTLTLYMSSPGGDYFEGLAVASQLSRYAKAHDVTVVVDGEASSVGSVIAISAPHVVMAPKAQMMIHGAWAPRASGTPRELIQLANRLTQATEDMVSLYAQRTKQTPNAIREMIAQGDFYMSAEQAVELGFADEVLGQPKPQKSAPPAALDPKRQLTAARINIAVRKSKRRAASR